MSDLIAADFGINVSEGLWAGVVAPCRGLTPVSQSNRDETSLLMADIEQPEDISAAAAEKVRSSVSERFGFRYGDRGPHASRTIMLTELRDLLAAVPVDAPKTAYRDAIMDENVLGKNTQATRRESYERMGWLYALDPSLALFRNLRFFWNLDRDGQPLLAFLCAAVRDPLLRMTIRTVLDTTPGAILSNDAMEAAVLAGAPGRFNPPTVVKIARNAASSWTHSGHLLGRRDKKRTHPVVTPAVTAYALLLGYLEGVRGNLLFNTVWTQILDSSQEQLIGQAGDASRRGWIDFRRLGTVIDVAFPRLLTPAELEALRE